MNNFSGNFKDMNLVEMLGWVLGSHDKDGLLSTEPLPKDLLTSVEVATHYITKGQVKPTRNMMAQSLFQLVYRKFMQCSEKERRSIVRSDMEFIYAIKKYIIYRVGIADNNDDVTEQLEQEVYDNLWIPTPLSEIPKMPRGEELLWSASGDLPPVLTEKEKQANKRINDVFWIIWENIEELYPVEYAKTWPIVQSGQRRIMINSNKKETSNALLNETGQRFYNVAVPWLTNAAIDLVTKTCNSDKARQKEMYVKVMNATWEEVNEA